MKFTVFGASGFIGSSVAVHLRAMGHEVATPHREEAFQPGEHLGHVIYAIGLTGNFRERPFETVDAHVTTLAMRLRDADYDSWLYLSTTRVYGINGRLTGETDRISTMSGADGIYDISKLLGESLCLALGRKEVRVARLSNVYGLGQSRHTFLGSLLEEVAAKRAIVIREDPASSKDYISIVDVVNLIEKIALHGQHQIYNLASGSNIDHQSLAGHLSYLTHIPVSFLDGAPLRRFPRINVARIAQEFGLVQCNLLDDLEGLVAGKKPNFIEGS